MGILGKNKPRTQKEKRICDNIIRYMDIVDTFTAFNWEGYQSSEKRLDKLYQELKGICKEDPHRFDENMFYIKANIKHHKTPKKVKIGGSISGVGGAEIEIDDRPNQ